MYSIRSVCLEHVLEHAYLFNQRVFIFILCQFERYAIPWQMLRIFLTIIGKQLVKLICVLYLPAVTLQLYSHCRQQGKANFTWYFYADKLSLFDDEQTYVLRLALFKTRMLASLYKRFQRGRSARIVLWI